MTKEQTLQEIIRYASLAPSGHNTQPWKFRQGTDSITILPDFSRSLKIADPDNHAIYISLGCALENLVIAAAEFSLESTVSVISTEAGHIIRVRLTENPTVIRTGLFEYIPTRQVRRNYYKQEKVSPHIMNLLLEGIENEMVRVRLFNAPEETKTLEPYILKGTNLQYKNQAFVSELVSWCRFSSEEAMRYGDGLYSASMGLPSMSRRIGTLIMKNFVTAKSESKRWKKCLQRSSGLIMFMSRHNNPEGWISLGRAFQRFGLGATKFSISHAHVNMPCEEPTVRKEMSEKLDLKPWTPLLLIRFGYSDPMPSSMRRNSSDMIIGEGIDKEPTKNVTTITV